MDGGVSDLSYSLGLSVADDGAVKRVAWDGPAFRAGLSPGGKVVSVNGQPYAAAALLAAVRGSAKQPVSLGVRADGRERVVVVDYRGPLRYPRLRRIAGTPARLDVLLAPRVARTR